jgi:hypothetical protein
MPGPLYVYAIVPAHAAVPRLVRRRLECVGVRGVAAVVERARRRRAPSIRALREQYRVIARLHEAIGAILPVRFGALVDEEELARILALRRGTLAAALRKVRGRSQMTVRVRGERPAAPAVRPPATGTDYLLSRAQSRRRALSPLATALLSSVASLAAAEAIEAGSGTVEVVHHWKLSAQSIPAGRGLRHVTRSYQRVPSNGPDAGVRSRNDHPL